MTYTFQEDQLNCPYLLFVMFHNSQGLQSGGLWYCGVEPWCLHGVHVVLYQIMVIAPCEHGTYMLVDDGTSAKQIVTFYELLFS
ncbi:unnamed protein product [Cercopithifilaria johnstoni]|uniref:Uncharacterized protein n=1 Tax=Cercopithifilaria johnstoni TaxID=2874296 RepID=A0A8J2LZ93_9BILA|nr:unnamed protein product [Cercopithifilaria johnstoni]